MQDLPENHFRVIGASWVNIKVIFHHLSYSLTGRKLAWQFVQDHWNELYNRYAGGQLFSRLIQVMDP